MATLSALCVRKACYSLVLSLGEGAAYVSEANALTVLEASTGVLSLNAAGNVSDASQATALTIDFTAPVAPKVDAL